MPPSNEIQITIGDLRLLGRLETERAPATCAAFHTLLPLSAKLLHVRWSGESTWVPLGDLAVGVGSENATQTPRPGQVLLYPGGVSETEILLPYGQTAFAAKTGPLWGNHFLTLTDQGRLLAEIGRRTLWEGAQDITFAAVDAPATR